VQGGVYADPLLARIVAHLRGQGIRGVGQSSWGPTLYALAPDAAEAERIANDVEATFALTQPGEVLVTEADNTGAVVRRVPAQAGKSAE
jgi:beta-ribofuranosylaminobenzene 5'-phosphate synthase